MAGWLNDDMTSTLHPRGCTAKSRTGMTEIMPAPRNLHITVLLPMRLKGRIIFKPS